MKLPYGNQLHITVHQDNDRRANCGSQLESHVSNSKQTLADFPPHIARSKELETVMEESEETEHREDQNAFKGHLAYLIRQKLLPDIQYGLHPPWLWQKKTKGAVLHCSSSWLTPSRQARTQKWPWGIKAINLLSLNSSTKNILFCFLLSRRYLKRFYYTVGCTLI